MNKNLFQEPIKYRQVVVVDGDDVRLGMMDILAAHEGAGVMHRAISVWLWRKSEWGMEVLLQKRGEKKPLWPRYWSNSVCTHPLEGEDYLDCGVRRLKEEMGVSVERGDLEVAYRFEYQARYNKELSEYELDTVVVGEYGGRVIPNPDEVADYRWVEWGELEREVEKNLNDFTPWLRMMVKDERLRFGRE